MHHVGLGKKGGRGEGSPRGKEDFGGRPRRTWRQQRPVLHPATGGGRLALGGEGFADFLQEGNESGDAQHLGAHQQSLDPLRVDLDLVYSDMWCNGCHSLEGGSTYRPDTVEDADDELDILQGEVEVVGGQLLVQVDDGDGRLVAEKVAEIFAAGREHHLVRAQYLATADERNINITAC